MTAPAASGWSVRRVGFAPTGKRRLVTAHRHSGHREALKPEASVAIDPTRHFATFSCRIAKD
jgi:hypothetical protein